METPVPLLLALEAEHRLIERVAGAFVTWAEGPSPGAADAARFLRFFRRYANDFHHAREEQVVLVALVEALALPKDRGPVHVVTADHAELAAQLATVERLVGRPGLRAEVTAYATALWHHIDSEDSVLFPESAYRLVRAGLAGLSGREATAEELEARDDGEALVTAYAPSPLMHAERGDGCIACPSFGVRCDGLEREWWTEAEWESATDRPPME